MDCHLKKKKLKYLVHRKGYDDLDCTWEPKSNLGNAKNAICDFYQSHSSTPCTLSINPADFLLLFQKMTRAIYWTTSLLPSLWSPGSWSLEGGSITVPSQELHFIELVIFFSFDYNLIFQTSNHEEILYENSLISCPSHFYITCVCLIVNLML